MATAEECATALDALAERLAGTPPVRRSQGFDRTLSCRIRDLDVMFSGRLEDGLLVGVRQIPESSTPAAQIKLDLSSDDLIALVQGRLKVPSALATKRLTIGAGIRDMMRLRSLF